LKTFTTRIQSKFYKNQIDNLSKCFIVSTGRTGTLFFESLLNTLDNQIVCYHEPEPDLYDIAIEKYRWQLEHDKLKEIVIKSREKYLLKAVKDTKSYYIESNNNLSFLINEINSIYKNVKFIVLVRDPRTYVVSALNKSPLNNNKLTFYDKEDHRDRLKPSDFKNDPYADTWNNLKRFEKISWFWNKCNSFLYEFHSSYGNSLLLKYEDIFALDLETRKTNLLKVFNFIGVEASEVNWEDLLKKSFTKTNKTVEGNTPDHNNWNKKDKDSLLEITKPMRTVLNY